MATAVDQAIIEIRAVLAQIALEHEGLRDDARLNLKPETMEEVNAEIVIYDRRVGLLKAALAANEALVEDGYPELSVRQVSEIVLEDLQENAASIAAALKKFDSIKATNLGGIATLEPRVK